MTGSLTHRVVHTPDGSRLHLEGNGTSTGLMLHGLGYASWETKELRAVLGENFGLWSLDNRGTGLSDDLAGFCSIAGLADDAANAIDELAGPQIVIGHSMGGYIAQALAATHPERVAALILIGTSPGGPDATPVPPTTIDAWLQAAGLPPDEYARRTMPLSFRPDWTEQHPEEFERFLTARLAHPTPPRTWAAQFAACQRFLATGGSAQRITAPTLVIHGTADRIVPVENGRLLASRIPGARYREIADAGHVVHLEQPRLIADYIARFVAQLEPTHR